MARKVAVSLLLFLSLAYAKDKTLDDFPMTVLVSYTDASSSGCNMTLQDESKVYVVESNTLFCIKFEPGSKLHAKRTHPLGVQMIELAWTNEKGKLKTAKYQIVSIGAR